mgnify:CR=1 FL=1
MHSDGQGYKKIAAVLQLSKNTVAKIVQNYQKYGSGTKVCKRSGRPRKISKRSERHIVKLVMEDRKRSASKVAEELSESTGVTVSRQTIARTLNRAGFHGRRPRRKPLLKADTKILSV